MSPTRYSVIEGAETIFLKGSHIGILVCHGFMGTPQSVVEFSRQIHELTGCTVLAPRLKGHGTCEADLHQCTHHDWFNDLVQAFHFLKHSCQSIFIAGQSMGAILALNLAAKGFAVQGIITINAALSVPGYECFRHQEIPTYIREQTPDIRHPIFEEITYDHVPISAIKELLKLIDETKDQLTKINCPALLIKSYNDHVVPHENTDVIWEAIKSKEKRIISLEKSYHVATLDCELSEIVLNVCSFIKHNSVQAAFHPN
ncbi:alpha/beta hydrolase [Falsibacillus albus]|uniref:Alpha/beta fold hydrolase n=1 Tax=Falsibacillus albus TaxID=2478915 RepID=A0A3L7JYD4_9BACI|nr:alpha/beta fold hydrolase [Falsibacillus albus]RLQ95540.1 alpha/beta fold hydrolase [Falsibacillus albus]